MVRRVLITDGVRPVPDNHAIQGQADEMHRDNGLCALARVILWWLSYRLAGSIRSQYNPKMSINGDALALDDFASLFSLFEDIQLEFFRRLQYRVHA